MNYLSYLTIAGASGFVAGVGLGLIMELGWDPRVGLTRSELAKKLRRAPLASSLAMTIMILGTIVYSGIILLAAYSFAIFAAIVAVHQLEPDVSGLARFVLPAAVIVTAVASCASWFALSYSFPKLLTICRVAFRNNDLLLAPDQPVPDGGDTSHL